VLRALECLGNEEGAPSAAEEAYRIICRDCDCRTKRAKHRE